MILEIAIAVVGGIGLASAIVSRMDKQDERRHPDGWQPRDSEGNTPDHSGGWVGDCPNAVCTAARQAMLTGRYANENAANYRAEELGRAQAERYTAEHRYQRAADPERYNNQTEREVEMWQPPTREEFNRFANEAWQAIQAAPHSNTPDANYQPTAAEAAYLGQQSPRIEARNNDGSTELPANFTGSVGNFAHANLRQARADAGGVWVRVAGQDVWVED